MRHTTLLFTVSLSALTALTALPFAIAAQPQTPTGNLATKVLDCRTINDLSDRLDCYDNVADALAVNPAQPTASLPGAAQQSPIPAQSARSMTTAAPQQPAVIETMDPEANFGKSEREINQQVQKKLEIDTLDTIRSKVVRTEISHSKEYVVYLENGQVWRQISRAGTWRIREGETLVITTASLGSYLMRAESSKKSVRARRLK